MQLLGSLPNSTAAVCALRVLSIREFTTAAGHEVGDLTRGLANPNGGHQVVDNGDFVRDLLHGDDGQEVAGIDLPSTHSILPAPVDWSALTAFERHAELRRLWVWVLDMVRTWPVPRDVVPPCWYRHESLIRILSAARDAYVAAYDLSQPLSAAAEWMHVWDVTEDRLRRWVSRTGCKSEHHPDRIQRWAADTKDGRHERGAFVDFVVADFEQHAAEELRAALDGEAEAPDA